MTIAIVAYLAIIAIMAIVAFPTVRDALSERRYQRMKQRLIEERREAELL